MTETVAVIVASYGDQEPWNTLGQRALDSVFIQSRKPDCVVRYHGTDLHSSRNYAALNLIPQDTDWLCFLDCDDEMEPGYLEAMMQPGTTTELRYPRVRYIKDSTYIPEPITLPRRALDRGNFMVIGTLVRLDTFKTADGFRDLPGYEDWDLWIRCWMLGADPRMIPNAIYRAHKRQGSRNLVSDPMELCREIISYNRQWQKERRLK